MTNTWMNGDGLYVKFGPAEATATTVGETEDGEGRYHTVVVDLSYGDFASSATVVGDNTKIPKGARIVDVKVETVTAFDSAGDAFVWNLGLQKEDRTTEGDYDGLVAADPQADVDAAGEEDTINSDHTYKGALIGTTLTYTGYVTADYDTAAPTAGRMILSIRYWMAQNREDF